MIVLFDFDKGELRDITRLAFNGLIDLSIDSSEYMVLAESQKLLLLALNEEILSIRIKLAGG